MYENKQKHDMLPEEKRDNSTQLSDILYKRTRDLRKSSALLSLIERCETNPGLQNVETRGTGTRACAFLLGQKMYGPQTADDSLVRARGIQTRLNFQCRRRFHEFPSRSMVCHNRSDLHSISVLAEDPCAILRLLAASILAVPIPHDRERPH